MGQSSRPLRHAQIRSSRERDGFHKAVRAIVCGENQTPLPAGAYFRSGLNRRRRRWKIRCLLRVESGHRLATSVHYPGSRRGEPPVKPSTIAEIEPPVVVRPAPAFTVIETAGEDADLFAGRREQPRATAADVGAAIVPKDTQVVPHISAPSRAQSGTSEQSTEPATPRKAIAWFSPADDAPAPKTCHVPGREPTSPRTRPALALAGATG